MHPYFHHQSIHAHIDTSIAIHINLYIHTFILTCFHPYSSIHTHMLHTYVYISYIHTIYMHECIHTLINLGMYYSSIIHLYIHPYTCIYINSNWWGHNPRPEWTQQENENFINYENMLVHSVQRKYTQNMPYGLTIVWIWR